MGETENLQKMIVYIVFLRYDELQELAQQTVEQLHTPEALRSLLRAITLAQSNTALHEALISAQLLP